MKIQVIQYSDKPAAEKDGMYFSPINSPRALDDYDINVIDLSVKAMWQLKENTTRGSINSYPDLVTISQMVQNKKMSDVIFVLPQNITYHFASRYSNSTHTPIKDIIHSILENTIKIAIPGSKNIFNFAFEATTTLINGKTYEADFYITSHNAVVTESVRSKKPTTVKLGDNVYVTSLAITKESDDLKHYIKSLFQKNVGPTVPEWINQITFGDDIEQKKQIEQSEAEIKAANAKIVAAEEKLAENARYKSILYTNGDELVDVVFSILEKLFSYDLSSFVDKKKEDFLIKLPFCTFIGEIKGVTSNIRSENISQIDLHYYSYLDRLAESGTSEKVKQLLIMNPFRNKELDKRDPVHISQINLAIRNECLVIETITLLRLYEKFCCGEVTSQQCIDVLSSKSGLLHLADFDNDVIERKP